MESGGQLRGGRRVAGRESDTGVGMILECVGEVRVAMEEVGRECCPGGAGPC
jgi:hypothetical protein